MRHLCLVALLLGGCSGSHTSSEGEPQHTNESEPAAQPVAAIEPHNPPAQFDPDSFPVTTRWLIGLAKEWDAMTGNAVADQKMRLRMIALGETIKGKPIRWRLRVRSVVGDEIELKNGKAGVRFEEFGHPQNARAYWSLRQSNQYGSIIYPHVAVEVHDVSALTTDVESLRPGQEVALCGRISGFAAIPGYLGTTMSGSHCYEYRFRFSIIDPKIQP